MGVISRKLLICDIRYASCVRTLFYAAPSAGSCARPVNVTTAPRLPQEFFENPAFRPDGLKLYPTLVIRGTGLYELWKTGRYKSYTPSDLVDLVARILALVPPWTRVYRVQRSEEAHTHTYIHIKHQNDW